MQHKKIVEVPAQPVTTREVDDKVTCDLCGTEIKDAHWEYTETAVEYRVSREVRLKLEKGTRWPEGGSSTLREYDICPKCFEEKLEPWLQSQGATPRTRETDY